MLLLALTGYGTADDRRKPLPPVRRLSGQSIRSLPFRVDSGGGLKVRERQIGSSLGPPAASTIPAPRLSFS